jgi:hypothetical protein
MVLSAGGTAGLAALSIQRVMVTIAEERAVHGVFSVVAARVAAEMSEMNAAGGA